MNGDQLEPDLRRLAADELRAVVAEYFDEEVLAGRVTFDADDPQVFVAVPVSPESGTNGSVISEDES